MKEQTIAEMAAEIEGDVVLEESDIVGLLKPYSEARDNALRFAKQRDRVGAAIKNWMGRSGFTYLTDGEHAITARLQERSASERYDCTAMPGELILRLHQARALDVDTKVIKALVGKDALPEEIKRYRVPGVVTTALVIDSELQSSD